MPYIKHNTLTLTVMRYVTVKKKNVQRKEYRTNMSKVMDETGFPLNNEKCT